MVLLLPVWYQGGSASDINALKTSKSTLQSVRTAQRAPGAWSKNRGLLPQYM